MIELTEQQRRELKGDLPRVLDPQTKKIYVLVSEEAYERMQALLAPERLPRTEQQALLHAAGLRAGWDDPEMEIYDREEKNQGETMNVQRGDVVMVDWIYSDRTGSKRRPALVIQANGYNAVLDDTILALITSSARRRVGAASQLEIDVSTPDGQQTGLSIDSVVQCENLVTIDRQLIYRIRGRLSVALMLKVDDCLKAALELP